MDIDNEINDSKNESKEEKSGVELSHEQGGSDENIKRIEYDIPTYTSDNSIEFIIFVYNNISNIYEPNKRNLLLLILLLNAIKNRDDSSSIFKQLLYATYRIFINNQIDEETYNFKSPINNISDKTWNSLKQINESCSNCFSLFLNDIENHKKEWETYLDNDEMIISANFILNNENVESCFTPLTKFMFFSILKPHLGHSLIDAIIKDILINEGNFQKELCLNNNIENTSNLNIDKYRSLEDLFKENISIKRKPMLYFEVENGNLCLEKEIRDYYIKKMKNTNVENNNNNIKQEGNTIEHLIHYKEINPNKLELSNSELEMIHNSMRTGGIILIKNPLLVEESLLKLIDEIKDKNTIINENFKLILLVNKNHLLPQFLYSSTNIIHNDFVMLKEIKEYIINLIKETPIDLFNKFINSELNVISFHMKKIYIYLLIINAILIQYSYIHSKIYKIPIDFCKKDFIISLKFIEQYISSINEEKMKALLDPDNNFGFNFDSINKIVLDTFINSRLIYREDEEKVHKMLSEFFDGEQFLRENNYYFNYNDFIIPKINEKLYPKKKEQAHEHEPQIRFQHSHQNISNITISFSIPKDAVIEEFEKIPNEKYYNLLYGVSNEMINNKTSKLIYQFFKIFSKNSVNESNILKDNINNISKIPEIFNINSNKIIQILDEIKSSLPDILNIADANPTLFKVNKYNELFNPLDECLQKEIDFFNLYMNTILKDIDILHLIMQGDMILNDKYYNILIELNKNIVPKNWQKNKLIFKNVNIEVWLNKLKYIYETMNNWINNGFLLVYDLSTIYNTKLFIITLPIYFQKKLQENNSVSSDKISIEYKLTKYEKIEEINDSIIETIKQKNGNNDFILIKGLKLQNFDSFYEKETKVFQENLNKKEGEELPIILVTYSINSFDNIEKVKIIGEEEDSEEDTINNKNISQRKVLNVDSSISKYESLSQIKDDEEEEYDLVQDINEISTQKKHKNVHIKEKKTKKSNVNIMQKYKYFTLKKYCKLNVPIVDLNQNEIYELNEPLGYIELKFKCTNDKQEEYFINNKIQIDINY